MLVLRLELGLVIRVKLVWVLNVLIVVCFCNKKCM